MTDVASRLHTVLEHIRGYESRHGRTPGSVKLLAVTKTKPAQDVAAAYAAGQRAFGENHLQDAMGKLDNPLLAGLDLEWHFIGPLQSNKTRTVAERFDWMHSLDRLKVARRLDEQRPPGLEPLSVCIQVNISGEASKSGLAEQELEAFADAIGGLPRLRLRGLMGIPAPAATLEEQRTPFRRLRELQERLRAKGHELDTLSMGMTDDMEAAIAEGSTLVRIGTAIFGPRPAPAGGHG
jgi:pyridoxal phosphate enzyme (YggS family)